MKTKILSLLFLGILTSVFAFADGTEKTSQSQSKTVGNYIMNQIAYPEFAVEKDIEAEIRVSITVNQDGTVNVIQANCVEKELLNYFLTELKKIKFSPDMAEKGKVYRFKYSFKLL